MQDKTCYNSLLQSNVNLNLGYNGKSHANLQYTIVSYLINGFYYKWGVDV